MDRLKMIKIVSGGQTGVDRADLDAALDNGVECGGWCPAGRMAEDGFIPDKYPVKELEKAGYRQRTIKNVVDSDGTVVIYFGFPTGGTQQTIAHCIKRQKPCLLIDASELTKDRAAQRIVEFIELHGIDILNFAGPRGSLHKDAHNYTYTAVSAMITTYEAGRSGEFKIVSDDIQLEQNNGA